MPDTKKPSDLARNVATRNRKVTVPRVAWLERLDKPPEPERRPPMPSVKTRARARKNEKGRPA